MYNNVQTEAALIKWNELRERKNAIQIKVSACEQKMKENFRENYMNRWNDTLMDEWISVRGAQKFIDEKMRRCEIELNLRINKGK